MPLPLLTTTIGSFPKPKYTPIRDWFDISREKGGMNCAQTTRNYAADLSKNKEKNEELFVKAAKEVIDQAGDVAAAAKGKTRRGRKPKAKK